MHCRDGLTKSWKTNKPKTGVTGAHSQTRGKQDKAEDQEQAAACKCSSESWRFYKRLRHSHGKAQNGAKRALTCASNLVVLVQRHVRLRIRRRRAETSVARLRLHECLREAVGAWEVSVGNLMLHGLLVADSHPRGSIQRIVGSSLGRFWVLDVVRLHWEILWDDIRGKHLVSLAHLFLHRDGVRQQALGSRNQWPHWLSNWIASSKNSADRRNVASNLSSSRAIVPIAAVLAVGRAIEHLTVRWVRLREKGFLRSNATQRRRAILRRHRDKRHLKEW